MPELYLCYLLFYIWFVASCTITFTANEINSLMNWEKVVLFILWPIMFPIFLMFALKDWFLN